MSEPIAMKTSLCVRKKCHTLYNGNASAMLCRSCVDKRPKEGKRANEHYWLHALQTSLNSTESTTSQTDIHFGLNPMKKRAEQKVNGPTVAASRVVMVVYWKS